MQNEPPLRFKLLKTAREHEVSFSARPWYTTEDISYQIAGVGLAWPVQLWQAAAVPYAFFRLNVFAMLAVIRSALLAVNDCDSAPSAAVCFMISSKCLRA